MKDIFKQVPSEHTKALEQYLAHGSQRIMHNREWCGLSLSDFTTFYVELHDGKLADALVKFALTAKCESSNTLLSLMGFQEFAKDAFDEFIDANAANILKTFNKEIEEYKSEAFIAAAGF
ncbi:hypothetical protein [Photobacterium nomapromontoriensis]|uniref:hypothetical protein n=1 Tax=Photobacterium nomapromontoriensis TaxID=2910237 RepID=UPI003D128633